ncbi:MULTISPECIES: hypothetical protein [Burkholderia]|nr:MULTISPECIES: hypothetical protein [Burkholderia]
MQRRGALDEADVESCFTPAQRAYFRKLTAEEMKRYNALWFATPLPQRHSADMPQPPWDFGSFVDALANGEYEIGGVTGDDAHPALSFHPFAYPYGGTGSLVALIECLGNEIVGMDDGTGLSPYRPVPRWNPDTGNT